MNSFTNTQTIPTDLAMLQHLCQKVSTAEFELNMTKTNADVTTHGDGGAAEMFASRVPAAQHAYEDALMELSDFLSASSETLMAELECKLVAAEAA